MNRTEVSPLLRRAALAVALAMPVAYAAPAFAQDGPAMAEPSEELAQGVEDFFHFGKLGRYDLAVAKGTAVLDMGGEPAAVLKAFRDAAAARGDQLDQWLAVWQGVDDAEMVDVTSRLVEVINEGRQAVASDPAEIRRQIERLAVNEFGYRNGLQNLRTSGELAVPLMLQYLGDPDRSEFHNPIRRALRDMGRLVLNPLVAATQTDDANLLTDVVSALGDIGYGDAAPYLKAVAESDAAPSAKEAANEALAELGVSGSAGDLFYQLAERLYYDRSSITADSRYPEAFVWSYTDNRLSAERVPPVIFNEIMAMRASASALEAGKSMDDALSLWIAANYKRAAELGDGTDASRPADDPGVQYYGVTAGSKYTSRALARALADKKPAVALSAIESLQSTLGDTALSGSAESAPLIDAMSYPDRRVRFEAAMALAGALPSSDFENSSQVVPLLGEALSQTGQPQLVVLGPNRDMVNAMAEDLRGQGYQVAGVTSASEAVQTAQGLAAVDAVLAVDDVNIPAGEIDRLLTFLNASDKTAGSARIILANPQSSYAADAEDNPLMTTTTAEGGAGLAAAIEEGRAAAGSLPLDEQLATEYSLRAGELLKDISESQSNVFNLAPAKGPLLDALDDEREAVVLLAADVLGGLDDADAQLALASSAGETGADADVRSGLYEALAKNARNFGNKLSGDAVNALRGTVVSEPNLEVRTAAAKAYGALNLPAEQAKQIIIGQ
ncbi:MAG: HEAT repeat domain-containing protein [Planctomycetota bacterium]